MKKRTTKQAAPKPKTLDEIVPLTPTPSSPLGLLSELHAIRAELAEMKVLVEARASTTFEMIDALADCIRPGLSQEMALLADEIQIRGEGREKGLKALALREYVAAGIKARREEIGTPLVVSHPLRTGGVVDEIAESILNPGNVEPVRRRA